MTKQSGFGMIEIVVALVVVAVLAAAGFLFVQGINKQQESANNSSTESASMSDHDHMSMSNEDHQAMMADWQTFTSDQYGFTFSYPQDWTVEETTVEAFPNQPNAIVKNKAGQIILGVYGYLGTGCEDTPTGNEPTEVLTIADTEVIVAKDCNSSWHWITAKSHDGSDLFITTQGFLGQPEEEDARMLLQSLTGISDSKGNVN